MNYYDIGQRIRKYRKAYGLSQEQLAESAGISVTHMSHIETGNTKLSLPVLVAISESLSVQIDVLIYGILPTSKTTVTNEISNLMESCSPKEAQIIHDTVSALKTSLDKWK